MVLNSRRANKKILLIGVKNWQQLQLMWMLLYPYLSWDATQNEADWAGGPANTWPVGIAFRTGPTMSLVNGILSPIIKPVISPFLSVCKKIKNTSIEEWGKCVNKGPYIQTRFSGGRPTVWADAWKCQSCRDRVTVENGGWRTGVGGRRTEDRRTEHQVEVPPHHGWHVDKWELNDWLTH